MAGIAVLAAVIRFWNLGSLGYSHWDDYYFVGDANTIGEAWPHGWGSVNYATGPMMAYTDGTLFHFFGTHSWMPFAVSAAYGTFSSIALYFLGSRLFGKAVGLIAAAILTTAEFSVMYSRMALADATFSFWLIASVLFIWLGFTRRRLRYWVLAGISSGLLLNTKYDGVFTLILAATWLIVEFGFDLAIARRRFLSRAWSEYVPRLIGLACLFALAIALFAPYLLKLAHFPGYQAVIASHGAFAGLLRTPPKFIVWYFWLFTSPPTVLLTVVGIVVGTVRFTQADRFMLIYTVGWFSALMLFDPYPREALSLLPAVAIWAGRATVEVWKLIRLVRPRLHFAAAAASVVCVSAILFGQITPLPHLLSLRTKGYADAAVIIARYQATGGHLFVHTQACELLYVQDWDHLYPTPAGVQLLKKKAPNLYFMTDQTAASDPRVVDFFELNRDRLEVLARVPNPLYPEVLLQPATEEGLTHLDNPPDVYRYITIWHVTGPLLFPPSWPAASSPP